MMMMMMRSLLRLSSLSSSLSSFMGDCGVFLNARCFIIKLAYLAADEDGIDTLKVK
jgi:hypothetical protein